MSIQFDSIQVEHYKLDPTSFHILTYQSKQINTYIAGPEIGPPLLFIHGFNFSIDLYSTFINQLITTYRVLAVDLPGHGKTDGFEQYTPEVFKQVITFAAKHHNFTQFYIVGHSMGGFMSLYCYQDQEFFNQFLPKQVIALAPSGLKTFQPPGQEKLGNPLVLGFLKQFPSIVINNQLKLFQNSKVFWPQEAHEIIFEKYKEQINRNKKLFSSRVAEMGASFPWQDQNSIYENAFRRGNVCILYSASDLYINTIQSKAIALQLINDIQNNQQICSNAVEEMESIHALPIVHPKTVSEVVRKYCK